MNSMDSEFDDIVRVFLRVFRLFGVWQTMPVPNPLETESEHGVHRTQRPPKVSRPGVAQRQRNRKTSSRLGGLWVATLNVEFELENQNSPRPELVFRFSQPLSDPRPRNFQRSLRPMHSVAPLSFKRIGHRHRLPNAEKSENQEKNLNDDRNSESRESIR